MIRLIYSILLFVITAVAGEADAQATATPPGLNLPVSHTPPDSLKIATQAIDALRGRTSKPATISPYAMPYSVFTASSRDWHRLWVNTGVLLGAFTGTLFVLEMLPEDATSWNRASLQDIPPARRWSEHVFRDGPEWDSDNPVFNYILHPYAGAVYFMTARSNGFNFYQSMLYSALISTVGWEFGIEACMERPSNQDIFVTPIIGSIIGECFYMVKRHIVDNGYRLAGSAVLGGIVSFLVDPVNEIVGLFNGNPARRVAASTAGQRRISSSLVPKISSGAVGLSFSCTF